MGVAHLGGFVVVLHHGELGVVDRFRGLGEGWRRGGDQQVPDRRLIPDLADELAHDSHVAGAGDGAFIGGDIAGDDAQQCGFARAIGADQGRLVPVADLEADGVEQLPPVGEEVVNVGNV